MGDLIIQPKDEDHLKLQNDAGGLVAEIKDDDTTLYLSGNLSGGNIEGTAIKSTGESGGTKFLREDGDGTCSWQAAASSGGLTHLLTANFTTSSGDTGSTFGDFFEEPYKTYKIFVRDVKLASGAESLNLRFYKDSGSVESGSNYDRSTSAYGANDSAANTGGTGSSYIMVCANVGAATGLSLSFEMTMNSMQTGSTYTQVYGTYVSGHSGDYTQAGTFGGRYKANSGNTDFSGVSFYIGGGISFTSGTCTVFGVKES
jgi:hypothetical protein